MREKADSTLDVLTDGLCPYSDTMNVHGFILCHLCDSHISHWTSLLRPRSVASTDKLLQVILRKSELMIFVANLSSAGVPSLSEQHCCLLFPNQIPQNHPIVSLSVPVL